MNMMRFVVCVPDEVGEAFKSFCESREESAYSVLSQMVHKVVKIERKQPRPLPPALAKQHRLQQIRAKQGSLQTVDRRPRCPFCKQPGDAEDVATCIGRGRCQETGKFLEQ